MRSLTIERMSQYLSKVPPGELSSMQVRNIEELLAAAWEGLEIGGDDSNMAPYKPVGRTENLAWNPPLLTFDIERHGQTFLGSVYATVYSWSIDLSTGTARMHS